MGILSGVASMVTFGLTEYEIMKIQEKMNEMKGKVDHNEGQIKILSQVMKYNSKKLKAFRDTQIHTNEILSNVAVQLTKNIDTINEVKLSIVCINLKLTYMEISKDVDNVMHELRDLIQYKFNKDLLEWDVRRRI